jgi:hypothetical protein
MNTDKHGWAQGRARHDTNGKKIWSAVAERSGDGAIGFVGVEVTRLILSEKSETPYVVSYRDIKAACSERFRDSRRSPKSWPRAVFLSVFIRVHPWLNHC